MNACARCGEPQRTVGARRLCRRCRDWCARNGQLDQYPRITRTLPDFAADYLVLRGRGLTFAEIAKEMGYQHRSMDCLVWRARQANLIPPYAGDCNDFHPTSPARKALVQ